MTHDEIIEMGRQATNNEPIYCRQEFTFSAKQLQAFANLVAAKEKEANIKIIKETPFSNWFQADVIEAIRARGEQA